MSDTTDPPLNPAQQEVIALLGRQGDDAPELPDGIVDELRDELEGALAPLADAFTREKPLWVSKHKIATIHQCEAHHAHSLAEDFTWSPQNARGTIAHRAIEIMVNSQGEPPPGWLVDETLGRLVDDASSLGAYVAGLGEFERAELRGIVVDHVSAFQECFPPIKSTWTPRTESKVAVYVADGRIVLSGKVDLTLGRPGKKVIIDLKTGRPSTVHREDLRFYALLETIRMGLPPRKVASYYLDAARPHAEDVTEGSLRAALRRTVDGVMRIYAVTVGGQEPTRTAGAQCRWCGLADECDTGRVYLASLDDA
jgi:hypothetical protein